MSITTVLESAEDQCRMPVTCGSKPASSGVDGEGPLASFLSPSLFASGAAGTPLGVAVWVAAAGVGDRNPGLFMLPGLTAWARWPSVHHTPAPMVAANNTSAATTARPGREWSSPVFSAWRTGTDLGFLS